jgi:GPH family glycoside/pentoside/hexuronide:cation symporter
MVTVPYEALGAELSFNYDERSRLLGTREAAVLAGTLVAAVIPIVVGVGADLTGDLAGERARYLDIALIYTLLVTVLIGACVLVVPERRWAESQRPEAFLRNLAGIWHNRPFRILLGAYAVTALGFSVAATVILFYVQYVLGSAAGPLFLAVYLGIGTATVPFWIFLARRLEKRRAWLIALGVNTVAFIPALLLGRGDAVIFGVIVVTSALGVGGVMAIPPSMQADTIDYDEWTTGTRREGEYIGFWSIVKKLAAALSAGLAFPILDFSGYMPGSGQQAPAAIWALRLLYVGTPSLCNLIAIGIAWRYPIDRVTHEMIRDEIEARLASSASTLKATV